jgi:hypothetical protein
MIDIRMQIVLGLVVVLVVGLLIVTLAHAQNHTTFRDAGGRTTGTASTPSRR